MRCVLFLTFFIPFAIFSAEDLLSKYKSITPFNEHWQSYKIIPNCRGNFKECIQLQDNSEAFNQLLEQTEKSYDEQDPRFLASPLGMRYQALKNFMHIQNSFKSCNDSASFGMRNSLNSSLQRLSDNVLVGACIKEGFDHSSAVSELSKVGQEIMEKKLEQELISDSLRRSLEARAVYNKMFALKPDDLCIASAKTTVKVQTPTNICSSEDIELLKEYQKSIKLPPIKQVSAEQATEELNESIAKVNTALRQYNQDRAALKKKWQEEDRRAKGTPPYILKQRKNELMQMKKLALENYWNLLQEAQQNKTGNLLLTDTVKNATGMNQFAELRLKLFGLGGVEKKVLKDDDDLALLSPLEVSHIKKAMPELVSITKEQVQDLLRRNIKNNTIRGRRDNIAHLMTANPASAGYVLNKSPEYADTFCSVAQNIAANERFRKIGKYGTYAVLGTGIAVGTAASFGGFLPASAVLMGAVAGGLLTAAEIKFHKSDALKQRELQKAILSAYVSNAGDKQSLEQMRKTWDEFLQANAYAKATWGFALVDIVGIYPAVKGVQFARMVKSSHTANIPIHKFNNLINRISKTDNYIDSLDTLSKNHPQQTVMKLIAFMSELPAKKQKEVLKMLPEAAQSLTSLPKSTKIRRVLNNSELAKLDNIVPSKQQLQKIAKKKQPVNTTIKGVKKAKTYYSNGVSTTDTVNYFKGLKKKVITFVGYSGAEYENPEQMLRIAKKVLQDIDPQEYIVNIGVTPEGIGQIYPMAQKMGFETYGIVSAKAKDYLNGVKGVDHAFLVTDEAWGGYLASGKLSPTSEAMVEVSDRIIGIGGNTVGYDELYEAINRGKRVEIHAVEMNHANAIKKAEKAGEEVPTEFWGNVSELVNNPPNNVKKKLNRRYKFHYQTTTAPKNPSSGRPTVTTTTAATYN